MTAAAVSAGSIGVGLTLADTRFLAGMRKATRSVERMSGSFMALGVAAAGAGAAISAGIGVALKRSSDYEENLNVLQTAFGSLTGDVRKWASETGKAVGRSVLDLEQYSAAMGSLFMGITDNEAAIAKMSTTIAQLAVDIGSFYNATDEDALNALRSGLTGEAEPLKRFAIFLTEANLAQFALDQGIKQSVKSMNQQQKTLLRYQYILAQTSKVQGDAERTSDSFANQVKALEGDIDNLAISMKDDLLPAATGVVRRIRGMIKAWRELAPETQKNSLALIAFGSAITLGTAGAGLFFNAVAPIAGALSPIIPPLLAITAGLGLSVAIIETAVRAWDLLQLGVLKATKAMAEFGAARFRAKGREQLLEGNNEEAVKNLREYRKGVEAIKKLNEQIDGIQLRPTRRGSFGEGLVTRVAKTTDDIGFLLKETIAAIPVKSIVDTLGGTLRSSFADIFGKLGKEIEDAAASAPKPPGSLSGLGGFGSTVRGKRPSAAFQGAASAFNLEIANYATALDDMVGQFQRLGTITADAFSAMGSLATDFGAVSGTSVSAIAAFAAVILGNSKQWIAITNRIQTELDGFADALGPILEPVGPFIAVLGFALRTTAEALAPVASLLSGVLAPLFMSFRYSVAIVAAGLAGAGVIVRKLSNAILRFGAWVLDFVAMIPGWIGDQAEELAGYLRAQIVPVGGVVEEMTRVWNEAMGIGFEPLADEVDRVTGSIANLPDLFKVAQSRSFAANVETGSLVQGLRSFGAGGAGAFAGTTEVNIYSPRIVVETDDGATLIDGLLDWLERERQLLTGDDVGQASQYVSSGVSG